MADIAVIGGGPAGMMAAGNAAQSGARVLLLEKKSRPGLKLLLTGGGRCNLTNVLHDAREMAARYGGNGRFFISALTRFTPADTVAFFNGLRVPTVVEDHGRVFPASGRAQDVLDALTRYMAQNGVEIRTGSAVKEVVAHKSRIEKLILADDSEVTAHAFVLATGGASYPATGATGDGFRWLGELGHTVVLPAPALSAVITKDHTAADLQGLSLREVAVALHTGKTRVTAATGDVLFTADGLSGPVVLDMSREAGKLLPAGVTLDIDLLPDTAREKLDTQLIGLLSGNGNKRLRSVLDRLMPARLVQAVLMRGGLDGEKPSNTVTREERRRIADLLKSLSFEVERLAPLDKAMVTAGGVDLREVDSKTMRSKKIENLFFAGEILDLDGPTGGYNLQVCWSTGQAVKAFLPS